MTPKSDKKRKTNTKLTPDTVLGRLFVGQQLIDLEGERYAQFKVASNLTDSEASNLRSVAMRFGKGTKYDNMYHLVSQLHWSVIEVLSFRDNGSIREKLADLILYRIESEQTGRYPSEYSLPHSSAERIRLLALAKELYPAITVLHTKMLQEQGKEVKEELLGLLDEPTPDLFALLDALEERELAEREMQDAVSKIKETEVSVVHVPVVEDKTAEITDALASQLAVQTQWILNAIKDNSKEEEIARLKDALAAAQATIEEKNEALSTASQVLINLQDDLVKLSTVYNAVGDQIDAYEESLKVAKMLLAPPDEPPLQITE